MMRRLLRAWSDRLPCRVIDHLGEPYLLRYHVCCIGKWRVYLHHFVNSDPDNLHNHPWKYGVSVLLAGRYFEYRRWTPALTFSDVLYGEYGSRLDKKPVISFVNGDTMHRVVIPAGETTWTLFAHSLRVCNWGFMRDKGCFTQYVEVGNDDPDGHSMWHLTAPNGREVREAMHA